MSSTRLKLQGVIDFSPSRVPNAHAIHTVTSWLKASPNVSIVAMPLEIRLLVLHFVLIMFTVGPRVKEPQMEEQQAANASTSEITRAAEIRAAARELVGIGMLVGADVSDAEGTAGHYADAERLTSRLIELCK
jgi:hypothetical protein